MDIKDNDNKRNAIETDYKSFKQEVASMQSELINITRVSTFISIKVKVNNKVYVINVILYIKYGLIQL